MLDGSEYKDYLYDVPLGVDTNDDGVSDGWTFADNGVTTSSKEIEENAQKITITNANSNASSVTLKTNVLATAGEEISIKFKYKTDNMQMRFAFLTQPSSTLINSPATSNLLSEGEYTEVEYTGTISVGGDTSVDIIFGARAININDTGSIWFKDAVLVKNSFIEDIGLLTQDDDSDGIANEWDLNDPTGATITRTVVGEQRVNVSASGADNDRGGISIQIPVEINTDYEVTIEQKVSGATGTFEGRCRIFQGGSPVIETEETNTEYETKTLNFTSDGSNSTIFIYLQGYCVTGGDTGVAHFKNATLKQTNNSTYVTKIFDKSGNGNHAIQTVASYQPRLINAGTFEVMSDGDYGMYFDGTDDRFDVVDSSGLDITSGDLSLLANFDPDGAGYIFSRNLSASTSTQYGLFFNGTSRSEVWIDDLNRAFVYDGTLAQKINIFTYDHINIKTYLNNVIDETVAHTAILPSYDNIQIGCRSGSTDGVTKAIFLTGHINRIVIFNKALSQTQITLLTNRLEV